MFNVYKKADRSSREYFRQLGTFMLLLPCKNFLNVKSDCYYCCNTAQLCSFHLQSFHDINDTAFASPLHVYSLSQNQGLNLHDISKSVEL